MVGIAALIALIQIGAEVLGKGQFFRLHGVLTGDGVVQVSVQGIHPHGGPGAGAQGGGAVHLAGIGVDAVIGHPQEPSGREQRQIVVGILRRLGQGEGVEGAGLAGIKGFRHIVGGNAVPHQLEGDLFAIRGDRHGVGVEVVNGLLQGKGHLDRLGLLRGVLHLVNGLHPGGQGIVRRLGNAEGQVLVGDGDGAVFLHRQYLRAGGAVPAGGGGVGAGRLEQSRQQGGQGEQARDSAFHGYLLSRWGWFVEESRTKQAGTIRKTGRPPRAGRAGRPRPVRQYRPLCSFFSYWRGIVPPPE